MSAATKKSATNKKVSRGVTKYFSTLTAVWLSVVEFDHSAQD